MTDDDEYDSFRDQCVNDPLWAADEIERLRAEVDGWHTAHGLCLEAIGRLTAERDVLRAIVTDLGATHPQNGPFAHLVALWRQANTKEPGEPIG